MSSVSEVEEYSHFFEVKLELFDGPIDLLLHLVKQNELPIEKVSLAQIASQYFACIESLSQFDLDVAAEYLVIAATLLSIKSSVLLNEPVVLVPDEDGNLLDPHEELLRRLREAEIYKEGAQKLGNRNQLGLDVFSPLPLVMTDGEAAAVQYKDHDPLLLGIAFKKLLEKAGNEKLLTIALDSVSIVERMLSMLSMLEKNNGAIVFYRLIPEITSRACIISCFIALLELCKRQVIHVKQDETFGEIYIVLAAQGVQIADFTDQLEKDYGEGRGRAIAVGGEG